MRESQLWGLQTHLVNPKLTRTTPWVWGSGVRTDLGGH